MTVKTVCPHAMTRILNSVSGAYNPVAAGVTSFLMSDGEMSVEWRVDEAMSCPPDGCACDRTERHA